MQFAISSAFLMYAGYIILMISGIRVMSSYCSSSAASSKLNVVHVTCPNSEVAKGIARGLVENQLAACVQIMPNVLSVYKWEGQIEESEEHLLVIKSKISVFDKLCEFVKNNHPYKVPEIITFPVERGLADYIKWVDEVVKEAN